MPCSRPRCASFLVFHAAHYARGAAVHIFALHAGGHRGDQEDGRCCGREHDVRQRCGARCAGGALSPCLVEQALHACA